MQKEKNFLKKEHFLAHPICSYCVQTNGQGPIVLSSSHPRGQRSGTDLILQWLMNLLKI